jgi:glycine/serine hydroxymethyltransferase
MGAAVRSELFGVRTDVLSVCSGIRVGTATLAQAGVEEEQAVAAGGFQCAVRINCDPRRSARKVELA